MSITKILLPGQQSRSVNTFVQEPDLGLRWDSTPRVSRPEKTNPPPSQISQFYPPGIIMLSLSRVAFCWCHWPDHSDWAVHASVQHTHSSAAEARLLYTADAADDSPCVDLGGRRTI